MSHLIEIYFYLDYDNRKFPKMRGLTRLSAGIPVLNIIPGAWIPFISDIHSRKEALMSSQCRVAAYASW